MTFIKSYELLPSVIKESTLLSKAQKELMLILLEFENGITMSELEIITAQSKQTLFLKIRKLLDRGFIVREKDMVFIYKINQSKMLSILTNYQLIQNNKKKYNTYSNTKKSIDLSNNLSYTSL